MRPEAGNPASPTVVSGMNRRLFAHPASVSTRNSDMHLSSRINVRSARLAFALAITTVALLASVAFAYANSSAPLPVEPDGGIGGDVIVLPVEPDGGIGTSAGGDVIVLPVEPDGGIGD
jgi:hypothetical protein